METGQVRSKRFARLLPMTAVIVSLAAFFCSSEPDVPSSTSGTEMAKVTLNFGPSMTYGPLMIARDAGYFEDEGIDVEFVTLHSDSALAALMAGKLDVLSIGVRTGVFNVIQRGAPIQVVIGKGDSGESCTSEAFVAPAAMADRIAAAGGDLEGERIAVTRGGVAEFLVDALLAERGVTLDDVIAIPMPHGAVISAKTEIEAVRYANEPQLSILLAEGSTKMVSTTDAVAPRHQSTFILYGERLLKRDPELGRRFMRAYLRGMDDFNAGKTERNIEILSRYTKLPPEILRQSCLVFTPDDGRIDPADIDPFLDWALARGYLDEPVTAEWWNPSFIEQARSDLAGTVQ